MKGVLLINLGSPNSTETKDVRKYLREFLMDGKVIDVPYLLRAFIVEGSILPTRPKKSAAAYQKIWWEEGSPLVVISKRVQQKLQSLSDIPIALGMRYGKPSIHDGLNDLNKKGVKEVLVIPLYPQYAMSSYETVVEKTKEVQKKYFPEMKIDFLPPFYNDELYLNTLAESIKNNLPEDFDLLLFSYHGIPERHIYKTDKTNTCQIKDCCFKDNLPSHPTCYRHQCYYVTRKVIELLNLPKGKHKVSFQSRLGKSPWLQPFTDHELEKLPQKNIKKLVVVTPAFVSDCLETLEEIAMEGKKDFLKAGGEEYTYIPCLNESDNWIETLNHWIKKWEIN